MTLNEQETERLLDRLAESQVLENTTRLQDSAGLRGETEISGQKAQIRLEVPSEFPSTLPDVYLEPWDALGFIPHVEYRGGKEGNAGKVCYFEKEGLVVNRRRPYAVLRSALDEALNVLRDGVENNNDDSFAREFEDYWSRLEDREAIRSIVGERGDVRQITWAQHNENPSYLAESESQIEDYFSGKDISGEFTIRHALFAPLKEDSRIPPPHPDEAFWTAEDLRSIVWENVADERQESLEDLANQCSSQQGVLLLGLPKPDGSRALIGVRFDQDRYGHPLLDGDDTRSLRPLHIDRRDKDFIVPRGGGKVSLSNKRVLLVGCGAVGGYLALELARSGIVDLVLVDPQSHLPENTFRHVLGRPSWRKNKAKALAGRISRSLPYMNVEAIPTDLKDAINEEAVDLSQFDLVIFATGDPTFELEMNEHLRSSPGGPRTLHTWVEPYGIGGHSLLTGNATDGACFECLYQTEADHSLHNRAAFAAPGQSFGKRETGCSSLYTPYGATDASRTANLALRLAVNALRDREKGNPLRSWKGNSEDFLEAGFTLSHRYEATQEQLHDRSYAFKDRECPVCQDAASKRKDE
jgi:hypothetical protein